MNLLDQAPDYLCRDWHGMDIIKNSWVFLPLFLQIKFFGSGLFLPETHEQGMDFKSLLLHLTFNMLSDEKNRTFS